MKSLLFVAAFMPNLLLADMGKIKLAVESASNAYNIEKEIIYAVISIESGFNIFAVGRSDGEIGLMQLHPRYFPEATYDIWTNIHQGTAYLAKMRDRCSKRYPGLAWVNCYNTGPNVRLRRPKQFPYYLRFKTHYERFKREGL